MLRAFVVVALMACCSGVAEAQPLAAPLDRDALFDAAFNDRTSSSLPLTSPGPGLSAPAAGAAPGPAGAYAVSFSRDWPQALRLNAGAYDLGISPHAAFGLSADSRMAEAGATVQLGRDRSDRLGDLGVRDGKAFGQQGRWYLFAAVSGKAVGLNMTRAGDGDWRRAGWSTDPTSKLVGDGQLGVGWRKGGMQAAFGYVHREIKVQNSPHGADNDVGDSMAAFTLSLRPHR